MILTAIVGGIVGMWIGFVIACLIRVSGDRDDDAWQMWVDHMLANETDGTSSGAPLELRGHKIVPGDCDNLVVLERGELHEIERLSALLERCRPYMRHERTCPFDSAAEAEFPCECGLHALVEEVDGWLKAAEMA